MNDDTLILYYYHRHGDAGPDTALPDTERRRIEHALENDAELAQRYATLCDDMDRLRDHAPPAAPPEAIARWHDALDRAADAETPARNQHPLVWLAAMAAVLVLGIGIGLNLDRSASTDDTTASTNSSAPAVPPATAAPPNATSIPDQTAPAAPRAVPAAFTRGLSTHMRESRRLLAELPQADHQRRADLIDNIVEQNLLFERAADANGSHDLARVLRAFRQSLAGLATPQDATGDIAADTDQLSFEMNVVLTRLSRSASHSPSSF